MREDDKTEVTDIIEKSDSKNMKVMKIGARVKRMCLEEMKYMRRVVSKEKLDMKDDNEGTEVESADRI